MLVKRAMGSPSTPSGKPSTFTLFNDTSAAPEVEEAGLRERVTFRLASLLASQGGLEKALEVSLVDLM